MDELAMLEQIQLPEILSVNDEQLQTQIRDIGKEIYEHRSIEQILTDQFRLSILSNEEMVLMFDMLKAYVRKEYDRAPIATIWMVTFALAYWYWPHDIVNDKKHPGKVGKIDDFLICTVVFAAIRSDINEFETWRRNNQRKEYLCGLDGALSNLTSV